MGIMKNLLLALAFASQVVAADIDGFWKTIDEDSGDPRCVVGIYESDGVHYGRIIGTFDDEGKMSDTIYHPKGRAPGVVGDPYYAGLDFIYNLVDSGERFKGKIIDPEHGRVYNAELWTQDGNLIVRGKVLFFGRNQEWLPVDSTDFPKGFKMPKLNEFKPDIPQVK